MKKLINIGVIGSNEGNGHPISFSSIFNGYNPRYLKKFCEFELIKEYLPEFHKNKKSNIIQGAKVNYIWTQSKINSYKISKISNIKNICNTLEEMSEKVDAVILARDDIKNHLRMAKIFLKKKIPIFIDKSIVPDQLSLKKFQQISKNTLYMSCSSARYTSQIQKISKIKYKIKKDTVFVVGYSKKNWMRYAHHLLEGIVKIFGYDVVKVRCISQKKDKSEIYQLIYKNGLNVSLYFSENLHLPINFMCLKKSTIPLYIPYEDYFFSIKKMMQEFEKMVRTKKKTIPVNEMIKITKIVIAGNLSKKNFQKFYSPNSLKVSK